MNETKFCVKCNHFINYHYAENGKDNFQCWERLSMDNNDFCGCTVGAHEILNRITFKIPIGDWSGDGHSECIYYTVSSAKSLKEVREAYFLAEEKLPTIIHPNNLANYFLETGISDDTIDRLKEYGFVFKDSDNLGSDEIANYVIWFINYGDPACDIKLEKNADDMLVFYGYDEKGRHIDGFGYGLFGN